MPEAIVNIFGAPPVEGLGTAGGFKIVVQDTGDNGLAALQKTADKVVAAGEADPHLQGLFTSFRADTPWLELIIDRAQAKDRGVSIDDVRTTLEVDARALLHQRLQPLRPHLAGQRAGPGRVPPVGRGHQAAEGAQQPERDGAAGRLRVGALRERAGAGDALQHVPGRGHPRRRRAGHQLRPGHRRTWRTAANDELPQTMRTEWTELALLQLQTGNTAMWVFLLAVVLVFLVLAAQYESWSLPLAVILVVPMCLLCAIAGVVMAKMDINIFTQIGFLVLVGLACKNAILIVEFAKAQREAGVPRHEATLEACQLRLRPIIMTSFAFILGVVPLMLSEGAGAEMRRTLGTAVFAGMLGVTLFGIFLTPVFYYVIQWFKDRREAARPEMEEEVVAVGQVGATQHAG